MPNAWRAGVLATAVVALAGCEFDPWDYPDIPAVSECAGVPATIGIGWSPQDEDLEYEGTEGDDVVVITNGPVIFDGLGGDDLICVNATGFEWGPEGPGPGFDSAVVIDAGPGNDTVHTFPAARLVLALLGEGDDEFHGGPGVDWAYGGSGANTIDTGDGPDQASGESGDDTVDGGAGNDAVWGGSGVDEVDGGPGNDNVHGGVDGEPDTISAGPGADSVFGSDHADETVDCGTGTDTLTDWGLGVAVGCETVVPYP